MSTWSARTRLARDRRRPEGFVGPMLATLVQRVPTGSGWQFEVKHDGYRMIARTENGKARIWSRWGLSRTASFPSVAESLPHCRSGRQVASEPGFIYVRTRAMNDRKVARKPRYETPMSLVDDVALS